MLTWYKIEAKDYAYKKTFQEFRNAKVFIITSNKGVLYTKINEAEVGWLKKIQRDWRFTLTEIYGQDLPSYYTAPCGQMTTTKQHQARCKSCRQLKLNDRLANNTALAVTQVDENGVDTSVKNILKLPQIQEFNIDGMLDLLKAKRDQAFSLSEDLDKVIQNIEGVNTITEQIDLITAQKDEFRKGIELFMSKEN